jgi:hypothetical protein
MRSFKKLLLAIIALAFSAALATNSDARLGGERLILGAKKAAVVIAGLFTPTAVTTYLSALFSPDAAMISGTINAGLKTPTAQHPFYLPSTASNSWFAYVEGTVDAADPNNNAAAVQTILANCASGNCSGGADKYLQLAPLSGMSGLNLNSYVRISGNTWWQSSGVSSVAITSGGSVGAYNPGWWPWTATVATGACTALPSGYYTVAASQISAVKSTVGGTCLPGTTFTVPTTAGWTGTGTKGTLTPSLSNTKIGILLQKGQHFCGVLGQYGADMPSVSLTSATISGTTLSWSSGTPSVGQSVTGTGVTSGTIITAYSGGTTATVSLSQTESTAETMTASFSGQQFAVFSDQSGVALPGSPAISTIVNNTATGTNFYYGSGVLRTQSSIGDMFNVVGASYSTAGLNQSGWGGQLGPIGMIWAKFPQDANGAPAASVLANVCQKNVDPQTYFASLGTVNSFYRLNDPGVWSDSVSGHSSSAYNLVPVTSGYPAATGSVDAPGAALKIADYGPYTTAPVMDYTAGTGTVPVSGTYNIAALGGTPAAIQAQISATPGGSPITGCASCAWANVATPSGGTWSGGIASVPAGGPYYVSVRASNGQAFVFTSGPVYVGLVFGWHGQSQQAMMWSATGLSLSLSSALGSVISSYEDTVSANTYKTGVSVSGQSIDQVGAYPIDAISINGTANNRFADGVVLFIKDMSDILNQVKGARWPIQVINLTRPGEAAEAWINGFMPQGPTALAASSSGLCSGQSNCYTLSGYFAYPSSLVGTSGAQGPLYNAIMTSYGPSILTGTARIYVNGAQVTSDATQSPAVGAQTYACSGPGISYCVIDYLNDTLTVAFTSSQGAAPVTASWTNIVDMLPNSSGPRTFANQYDGFDFVGNGAAASGYISSLMALAPFGVNAWLQEQCTSNSSEFSPYATGASSMNAKYGYLFRNKYPSIFPNVTSTTPIISLGYPRDIEVPGGSGARDNCQQWTQDFGKQGSGYFYGGTNIDLAVQNGNGPHETSGNFGGVRMSRRAALETIAALFPAAALPSGEPTISASNVVFDDTATYNAINGGNCTRGGSGNHYCINITVALNNSSATALQTCGSTINGAAADTIPPTGTCTDGGIGQHVEGFRIGTASTSLLAGSTYDDGLDPNVLAFSQPAAFICSQVAATVVQCVKTTSPPWVSGLTYLGYGNMLSTGRWGTLAGNAGGASFAITNAGAGYNAGTWTWTATGGGCVSEPTISLTVSGGVVTNAYPASPGASTTLCTSNPTWPAINNTNIPGIGTPSTVATITVPATATTPTDYVMMGRLLYDNSWRPGSPGIGGTINSILGGFEPGLPVTPVGIETLLQVNG